MKYLPQPHKCNLCNGTGDKVDKWERVTDCPECLGTGQTASGILSTFAFDRNELFYYDPYKPDEYGSNMSYGHLHSVKDWHLSPDNDEWDIYYVPSIMSGSDYSGGSVTVANYKDIIEQFGESDHVREVYGGYGTYAIAFNLSRIDSVELAQELVEIWESLADYPVIDEDTLSQVEMEAEEMAWETWLGEYDFPKALVESVNTYLGTPTSAIKTRLTDILAPRKVWEIEGSDNFDTPLYDLLLELMEKTNSYFENEIGNSAWVDLDRVCDARYILESEHWAKLVSSGKVEWRD